MTKHIIKTIFGFILVKKITGNKKNQKKLGFFSLQGFKDSLSGLRQFLANESPLIKKIKNVFYFILKALFFLKTFKVLS